MITFDTIRSLPLLAALDDKQCARVADYVAELVLNAGEYAVYEGEMLALFFHPGGTLEMTTPVGLAEQVVRRCAVGDYFGEMPILTGTASPAGGQATSPSRGQQLKALDFRRLVADQPAVAQASLAEPARRMTGLRAFAPKAPASRGPLTGPRWSPATYHLRDFLARNNVLLTWPAEDSASTASLTATPPAAPLAAQPNDGTVLTNPTMRALATALDRPTAPRKPQYDLAIVGAGPAAVYGPSEGLTTLLEREAPGGRAGTSSRIENYLGFPAGIGGGELGRRAFEQAVRLGTDAVITRQATARRPGAGHYELVLDGGNLVRARAVRLATGVAWRQLAVPAIDRLLGCGEYCGAARTEALAARGQAVYLVGGGNSAGQAAMFFANYARQVTVLVRKPGLAASMSQYLINQLATKVNITIEANSEVAAAEGAQQLEAILVRNHATQQTARHETNALFIFIGADVHPPWLPAAVACNAQGYVLMGAEVRTGTAAPCLAPGPQPLLPGNVAAGPFRGRRCARAPWSG